MQDRPPRRITSSRDAAEAMFKAATTKPIEAPVLKKPAVPGVKEQVTLRTHGRPRVYPDQKVHLAVDPANVHLFDQGTGQRLTA